MLQDLIAHHHHCQASIVEEDQALMVPWLLPMNLCNRADNSYHHEEADVEEEKQNQNHNHNQKKKKKKKKKLDKMRRNFRARIGPTEMSTQIEMPDGTEVSEMSGSGSFRHNPDGVVEDLLPGLDEMTALRCLAFVSLADRPRLAQVGHRYRDLVRSPLLFDLRRTYGVIERWVCIFTSGHDAWAAYDPSRGTWRSLPGAHGVVDPMFELSDRESLSAGTHLLWLGRDAFQFAAYRFDLVTNTWGAGPPMVTPRCLFASASCGAFAFVAGGFNVAGGGAASSGGPAILNSAERYDSRSGTWEPLPPMRTPRQKCSGVFMDGKFYVIGGKDKDHNPLTSGEVYDPSTKAWTTIMDMYVGQETKPPKFEPSPPLVAVADNELYSIDSSTNVLKGYDKRANSWKVLGPVPVRTDVCNGWGFAFKALGDELLVIGGFQESPSSREGVAIFSLRPRFDASTRDWHPHMPHPQWNLVNFRTRGSGSFLYNCAVMAC